jgi:hypothetical protein
MKSRQEKLKLFILLSQAIGLLVTLLCSFIGALYIFDGEWLFAFPISIVFVVAMYYLVIFFCKEKESRRKKGYPPIFYYLFGVYAIMSIILSFFVLHFYNVEINEKEEIQQAGLNKINGVEMIYKSYDSQYNAFVNTLEAGLNKKLTLYKTNIAQRSAISHELQANPYRLSAVDITSAINALSISQSVSNIKKIRINGFLNNRKKTLARNNSNNDTSYVQFLSDQKDIIEGWDRLSIGKSISDLNERIVKDYTSLNDYLTNKTDNNYKIQFDTSNYLGETLMNKPFDLAAKHMGPGTLIILLLFQLLILLPYFLTKGKMYGLN